eukprot:m.236658 g.236658  ORF g.236658 m.236658 type:complete len:188 (+) comp13006_c0_seq1:868-1431(+)
MSVESDNEDAAGSPDSGRSSLEAADDDGSIPDSDATELRASPVEEPSLAPPSSSDAMTVPDIDAMCADAFDNIASSSMFAPTAGDAYAQLMSSAFTASLATTPEMSVYCSGPAPCPWVSYDAGSAELARSAMKLHGPSPLARSLSASETPRVLARQASVELPGCSLQWEDESDRLSEILIATYRTLV